jgi:hypothetical protein
MSNKNLFKEAIADAKALRTAALLNAKNALEEALTPSIQNMLSARLNEMDKEEEELEENYSEEEMENEGFSTSQGQWRKNDDSVTMEGEEMDEDLDLAEILAELEKEEMDENELDEAKKAKSEEEESEEEESEEEKEEESEGKEVGEMSVEELKDLIKDIVSKELEAEEEETPADEEHEKMDMDMGMDHEAGENDEINLEELLAELDSLNENEEEMDEAKKMEWAGPKGHGPKNKAMGTKGAALKAAKEINFTPVKGLKELSAQDAGVGAAGGAAELAKIATSAYEKAKSAGSEFAETLGKIASALSKGMSAGMKEEKEEELEEAINVINTLRSELKENNLLNAKLLYVNKIFKAKNLSESQKLRVIASFDKATTPKQAKELFESIQSSTLGASKKSSIKESLGFASKAAGVAPKSTIVESNDVIARMQKLANIIK